jgi:hypothetical protein
MEVNEVAGPASVAARRSLRAARNATANQPAAGTAAAASGLAGTATASVNAGAGSESPRSDVSEGRGNRSSRLSNPEFAAKHKAFMAKVTAATKGSMDTYLTAETVTADSASVTAVAGGGGKRRISTRAEDQKRRRSTRMNSSGLDVQSDSYCWICHKVQYL